MLGDNCAVIVIPVLAELERGLNSAKTSSNVILFSTLNAIGDSIDKSTPSASSRPKASKDMPIHFEMIIMGNSLLSK